MNKENELKYIITFKCKTQRLLLLLLFQRVYVLVKTRTIILLIIR